MNNYPVEGVAFLSDYQIRQFGLTNLTAKESKILLSTIKKSLRENKKAIVQARKQENQTMKHLVTKINTIKQNLQLKPPTTKPEMKTIMHKGAQYNYTAIIRHSTGMHGNESMTKIIQSEEKLN